MSDHLTARQTAIDASTEFLSLVCERHAVDALVVITRGEHGWGFAVHSTDEADARLPVLLEEIADRIRNHDASPMVLAEHELGLPAQD